MKMKKIRGIFLQLNKITSNNTLYEDIIIEKKHLPIFIDFNEDKDPVGVVEKTWLENNNVCFEGKIEDRFEVEYIAPLMECESWEEKDGIKYPKGVKIKSLSIVDRHSQDVPKFEEVRNDEKRK
jgi:hypothetical protein